MAHDGEVVGGVVGPGAQAVVAKDDIHAQINLESSVAPCNTGKLAQPSVSLHRTSLPNYRIPSLATSLIDSTGIRCSLTLHRRSIRRFIYSIQG